MFSVAAGFQKFRKGQLPGNDDGSTVEAQLHLPLLRSQPHFLDPSGGEGQLIVYRIATGSAAGGADDQICGSCFHGTSPQE